jgi:hypothetical protein
MTAPRAATPLVDRSEPVPDEVWNEPARHDGEQPLASLIIEICAINAWNPAPSPPGSPSGQT